LLQVGESSSLRCDYDLEGDSLYSIKWYKDNQEFYRYKPETGAPSSPMLANTVEGSIKKQDRL
jgi:hypothetical protein